MSPDRGGDRPGPRFSPRDRAERSYAEARDAGGGALSRVRDELFALAGMLRGQPRLRSTLGDIGIPAEAKRALLGDLFGKRLDPRTLSLLGDLAAEDSVTYRLRPVLEDLAIEATLAEADAGGVLDDVADELFRFSRLVGSHAGLYGALTNPILPDDAKRAIVADLLGGRAPAPAVLLAEWAAVRLGDPAEHLAVLAERAAARHGRVVVEARTAVPLDAERERRLEDALGRATGRRVEVEVIVDPSVKGGVVTRVGDELIDGSVRRKLDLALAELTA